MTKLHPESKGWPGRRWLPWFCLLLLLPVMALLVERWRGQWMLNRWESKMAAQGEVFDARKLWPPVSVESIQFSNQFALTIARLSPVRRTYAGRIVAIVPDASGAWRRGSQEPRPILSGESNATNSWQNLVSVIQQNDSALQSLRELMKHPPSAPDYDAVKCLENVSLPNWVNARVAAQSLQAAAMNNLHRGDLDGAVQNLTALLSLTKLYEQDPTLVCYLIRIAILGLSVNVSWDALQADGWTEPQLAALQRVCPDTEHMLLQIPRTLEAERVSRIYQWNWYRSHDYRALIARYEFLVESFGQKLSPEETSGPGFMWQQWAFHPLWSFAWADQEKLIDLQQSQLKLTILRDAVQKQSLLRLQEKFTANRQQYQPPAAVWRFYLEFPMVDVLQHDSNAHLSHSSSGYPYTDFASAWSTTMKNLTLNDMVITTIAIKRYELQHGKPPPDLAALVPHFLPAVPRDLMDGQPLRYRANSNNTFTLYSVGEDMHDDGGDERSTSTNKISNVLAWSGKDLVWPVATAKGGIARK